MIRAAFLALLLASPAAAETPVAAAARTAADRLATAAALLDAAQSATDRIAALTETVRAFEDGLAALREGLRAAAIRQRQIAAELDSRRAEIARLLGVLQSIGRAPAPLLLLHPSGPLGTARSGMILAEVTPGLQAEAERLRSQLAELEELRLLQEGAARILSEGLAGVHQARTELAAAISNRTDLPRRFTENPAAMAQLIASADTLDAFAAGLAGTVDEQLAVILVDGLDRKGTLALPVPGTVLRRAGEADAAGIVRPGIVIATRPQALVTTPLAATLRYRGPLLDYGNVVILEPAPAILFVFAGLAQVYGEVGEVLPEGTPVGMMGGDLPGEGALLSETAAAAAPARSETLYLEVREGQSAVDPATWFVLD
jgi:septal ring factor EnvC (AmiA/AmiB activator)